MECFRCQCSSPCHPCSTPPSGCIVCSPDLSLTREELELLETQPRSLTSEGRKRRSALKRKLRLRSPETRARDNKRRRQTEATRVAGLTPQARSAELKRKAEKEALRSAARVAGLTPQARSAELKRKAEKEALRRAGMSRLEHERVLQQQRDAYRRRMNALSESDRREMNERIRRRRRRQRSEDGYAVVVYLRKPNCRQLVFSNRSSSGDAM